MKTRLLTIIILLILLTTLLVPSVVYADDPITLNPDFQLLEEAGEYEVFYNSDTKEYRFEKKFTWFWQDDSIPKEYRPTDPSILKALDEAGMNKKKVHIKRDYSADYPTAIIYREYDTENFAMFVTELPQVTPEGELIDCKWGRVGAVYVGGANWFQATVDDKQISVTSDVGSIFWNPQLFIGGAEQRTSNPTILIIDPTNSNYSYNVLEWDYGIVKRQIRLIEGMLLERWIVESNPYGEVRVKHNPTGNLSLGLAGAWDVEGNRLGRVEGDEEIVSAEEFGKAVYPVEIGAVLTVFSTASDGDIWAADAVYATAHDAATGTIHQGNNMPMRNSLIIADYSIYRGFFMWDTSALGAGAVITVAVASLYGAAAPTEDDATHPDVGLFEGVQDDPLQTNDYGDNEVKTTLGHADYYDVSVAWNGIYNNITLNATGRGWINKTGTTKLCGRVRGDVGIGGDFGSGTVPPGENQAECHQSEKGAGFQPKLVITYTVLPTVTSSAATAVEETSATLEGNVTSTGTDATVDERGFVYDTSTHVDPGNVAPGASGYASSWADAVGGPWGVGPYDSAAFVSGLTEGDQYFFRAYTHNVSTGYDYSNTEQTFLTKPVEPTNLAAVLSGSGQVDLTWNTGAGFDQTRIRMKVGAYPANELDGTLVYTAGGTSHTESGLTGSLTYYFRAWSWCTEGGLERYSDTYSQDNVAVLSAPVTACDMPLDASPPSTTEMYYSANVTSLGGFANYVERGFVWGTISVPANPGDVAPPGGYTSSWTETGTWAVTGDYDYDATGLTEGTTYYVRACAKNATYWGYSSEVVFNTYDEVVWYEPNTMISSPTLPDRADGDDDGTIHWGFNIGITIVLGEMESSEDTSASTGEAEGFDVPASTLPETWFAAGENLANLPFYDNFNAVATDIGMPVHTIYFLLIIGLAFSLALFVIVFTRSALLGAVVLVIVLFIGSSQTIIPMWIPFAILIVEIGILFLYRHVSY